MSDNYDSLPEEPQRKETREEIMARTWEYQVQQVHPRVPHRPVILPRVQGQQQHSEIRLFLSRKEHIPTGEIVVPRNQQLNPLPRRYPRLIPKTMSKTPPCCPESLPSRRLF